MQESRVNQQGRENGEQTRKVETVGIIGKRSICAMTSWPISTLGQPNHRLPLPYNTVHTPEDTPFGSALDNG